MHFESWDLRRGNRPVAQIIHWCMKCERLGLPAEVSREPAPHLKNDERSHGYCTIHGEEWLAEIRHDIELREQRKEQAQ